MNTLAFTPGNAGRVRLLVLLSSIALLSGCASAVNWESSEDRGERRQTDRSATASSPRVSVPSTTRRDPDVVAGSEDVFNEASGAGARKQRLLAFYRQWQGVPYQFGGSTSAGIDCSAFAQKAVKHTFGVALPRTTRQQFDQGVKVTRAQVKSGDLVFFKTGDTLHHVGIMLGEQRFLHASTSRGVTISKLDETYWKSRFIGFRRVSP